MKIEMFYLNGKSSHIHPSMLCIYVLRSNENILEASRKHPLDCITTECQVFP